MAKIKVPGLGTVFTKEPEKQKKQGERVVNVPGLGKVTTTGPVSSEPEFDLEPMTLAPGPADKLSNQWDDALESYRPSKREQLDNDIRRRIVEADLDSMSDKDVEALVRLAISNDLNADPGHDLGWYTEHKTKDPRAIAEKLRSLYAPDEFEGPVINKIDEYRRLETDEERVKFAVENYLGMNKKDFASKYLPWPLAPQPKEEVREFAPQKPLPTPEEMRTSQIIKKPPEDMIISPRKETGLEKAQKQFGKDQELFNEDPEKYFNSHPEEKGKLLKEAEEYFLKKDSFAIARHLEQKYNVHQWPFIIEKRREQGMTAGEKIAENIKMALKGELFFRGKVQAMMFDRKTQAQRRIATMYDQATRQGKDVSLEKGTLFTAGLDRFVNSAMDMMGNAGLSTVELANLKPRLLWNYFTGDTDELVKIQKQLDKINSGDVQEGKRMLQQMARPKERGVDWAEKMFLGLARSGPFTAAMVHPVTMVGAFSSAYQRYKSDFIAAGMDKDKAEYYGFIAGFTEILTERIGLEALGSALSGRLTKAVHSRVFGNAFRKTFLSRMAEKGISTAGAWGIETSVQLSQEVLQDSIAEGLKASGLGDDAVNKVIRNLPPAIYKNLPVTMGFGFLGVGGGAVKPMADAVKKLGPLDLKKALKALGQIRVPLRKAKKEKVKLKKETRDSSERLKDEFAKAETEAEEISILTKHGYDDPVEIAKQREILNKEVERDKTGESIQDELDKIFDPRDQVQAEPEAEEIPEGKPKKKQPWEMTYSEYKKWRNLPQEDIESESGLTKEGERYQSLAKKYLEMSGQEILERERKFGAERVEHSKFVEQALAEGESVPEKVAKEYKRLEPDNTKEIKSAIDKIAAKAKNVPDTSVVAAPDDLSDRIKQKATAQGVDYKEIEEIYDPDNDEVIVVASNMESADQAVQKWIHGTVGHRGVEAVLGNNFDTAMKQIQEIIGEEKMKEVVPPKYWEMGQDVMTREYMAFLSEKVIKGKDLEEEEQTVWEQIVGWIRDFFGVTDAEMNDRLAAKVLRDSARFTFKGEMPEAGAKDLKEGMTVYFVPKGKRKSRKGKIKSITWKEGEIFGADVKWKEGTEFVKQEDIEIPAATKGVRDYWEDIKATPGSAQETAQRASQFDKILLNNWELFVPRDFYMENRDNKSALLGELRKRAFEKYPLAGAGESATARAFNLEFLQEEMAKDQPDMFEEPKEGLPVQTTLEQAGLDVGDSFRSAGEWHAITEKTDDGWALRTENDRTIKIPDNGVVFIDNSGKAVEKEKKDDIIEVEGEADVETVERERKETGGGTPQGGGEGQAPGGTGDVEEGRGDGGDVAPGPGHQPASPEIVHDDERAGGRDLSGDAVSPGADQMEGQRPAGETGDLFSRDRDNGVVPESTPAGNTPGTEPVHRPNFTITGELEIRSKGQRKADNERAREILRTRNFDELTDADLDTLRKYSGEGGLSPGTQEALNQHYTDYKTIRSIFDALDNAGYKIKKALEPAGGVGNFLGIRPDLDWTTVDIDKTNHLIMTALYPEAKHYHTSFEQFTGKNFDLVTSNVPFLEVRGAGAATVRPDIKMLHDFYFAHALDRVKDNGIVAFISTKGTMDKKDTSVRQEIASKADVIGAFRLPQKHFESTHTDVITDIIFLQKRPEGVSLENSNYREDTEAFVKSTEAEGGLSLNNYYQIHPENVLGDLKAGINKMYGGRPAWEVEGNADLSRIKLPEYKGYEVAEEAETEEEAGAEGYDPNDSQGFLDYTNELSKTEDIITRRSVVVITQTENGTRSSTEMDADFEKNIIYKGGTVYTRTEQYEFKDIRGTGKVYKANGSPDGLKTKALFELNSLADQFQEKGTKEITNRAENEVALYQSTFKKHPGKDKMLKDFMGGLDEDNLYEDLSLLIDKDFNPSNIFKEKTRHKKSGVLQADKNSPVTERAFAEEDRHGIIDVSQAKLIEKSDIQDLLKSGYSIAEITKDNVKLQNDILYYSGNVYEKMEYIDDVIEKAGDYGGNLKSQRQKLDNIKPTPKGLGEINLQLNEPWFLAIMWSHFNTFGNDFLNITRTYDHRAHKMVLEHPNSRIERHLNNRKLTTQGPNESAGSAAEREREAQEQVNDFIEHIKTRITEYPVLLESIEYAHNSQFRNYVSPDYQKASYLIKDVLDEVENNLKDHPEVKQLRRNQIEWVVKALYEGRGINAHDVGGGKTFAAITLARVLKKKGISKKPLLVVPAKTLDKWEQDIKTLFPDASVENLGELYAKKRTQKLLAVAHKNPDFTIISHEGFKKVKLTTDTEIRFVDSVVGEVFDLSEARASRASAREAEKMEEFKAAIQNEQRDPRVTFEKLGFDSIIADEAHNFKNIMIRSSLASSGLGKPLAFKTSEDEEGNRITKINSARSYDFRFKSNYIAEQNNNKNVFLLTATPTQNKPIELFSMIKHLGTEALLEYGINTAQDFSNTFFQVGQVLDRVRDKTVSVLRKIVNMPELRGLTDRFIDAVPMEKMPWIDRPKENPIAHFLNPSDAYRVVQQDLDDRMERIEADPDAGNEGHDNIIAVYTEGRAGTIDPRIYGGEHAWEGFEEPPILARSEISDTDKIQTVIEGVSRVIKDNAKAGQLVFLDNPGHKMVQEGTLQEDLHREIKHQIMKETGLNKKQIAIINGKTTTDPKTGDEKGVSNKRKQAISDAYNKGNIKVVIGGTTSMGEGMDLQKYTTDIWHIDIPYKPGAFRQRNGRGLRPGNTNEKVNVHYLMARGTFDSLSYNIVASKKGWNDILWGKELAQEMNVEEEMTSGSMPTHQQVNIAMEEDPARKAELIVHYKIRGLMNDRQLMEREATNLNVKAGRARQAKRFFQQRLDERAARLKKVKKENKDKKEKDRKPTAQLESWIDADKKKIEETTNRIQTMITNRKNIERDIREKTAELTEMHRRYIENEQIRVQEEDVEALVEEYQGVDISNLRFSLPGPGLKDKYYAPERDAAVVIAHKILKGQEIDLVDVRSELEDFDINPVLAQEVLTKARGIAEDLEQEKREYTEDYEMIDAVKDAEMISHYQDIVTRAYRAGQISGAQHEKAKAFIKERKAALGKSRVKAGVNVNEMQGFLGMDMPRFLSQDIAFKDLSGKVRSAVKSLSGIERTTSPQYVSKLARTWEGIFKAVMKNTDFSKRREWVKTYVERMKHAETGADVGKAAKKAVQQYRKIRVKQTKDDLWANIEKVLGKKEIAHKEAKTKTWNKRELGIISRQFRLVWQILNRKKKRGDVERDIKFIKDMLEQGGYTESVKVSDIQESSFDKVDSYYTMQSFIEGVPALEEFKGLKLESFLILYRNALEKYGALFERDLGYIKTIADEIQGDFDEAQFEQYEKMREFDEKLDDIKLRFQAGLTPVKRRRRKRHKGFMQNVSDVFTSNYYFIQNLRSFARFGTKTGRKIFSEQLEQWGYDIEKAAQERDTYKKTAQRKLEQILIDTYGHLEEVKTITGKPSVNKIKKYFFRHRPEMDHLSKQGIEMNKDTIIQIYAHMEQPGYESSWEKAERDDIYKAELMKHITREDITFVEKLREYYDWQREHLSKTSLKLTGLDVVSPNPWYVPVEVKNMTTASLTKIEGAPLSPPWMTARVHHSHDLNENYGILGIWESRMTESAHYTAYAPISLELRTVFKSPVVREAIEKIDGGMGLKRADEDVRDIINGRGYGDAPGKIGKIDKTARFFRKLSTHLALLANPKLFPVQVSSVFAYGIDKGLMRTARYAGLWLKNPKQAKKLRKMIMEHDFTENRLLRGGTEMLFTASHRTGGAETFMQRIIQAGYMPARYGDIQPAGLIGPGIYLEQVERAKQKGLDQEAAHEWAMVKLFEATNATQQSTKEQYLPRWVRQGGEFVKMMSMYTSVPRQWFAGQTEAFQDAVASWQTGIDRKERTQRLLGVLALKWVILPGCYWGAHQMFELALGIEDDDPKDKWLELFGYMVTAPVAGLLLVGSVGEMIYRKQAGLPMWNTNLTPASDAARFSISVAEMIGHVAVLDLDQAGEDFIEIIDSMSAIRYARKALESQEE